MLCLDYLVTLLLLLLLNYSLLSQKVLKKGDGMNQLKEYIGYPKEGDVVKLSLKGRVKSTGKEFDDTHFLMLLIPIEIGSDYTLGVDATPISWTRGLAMATEGMLLGDHCELEIRSDYAYGTAGKKCNHGSVGPGEDIVVTVEVRQINHHRRNFKEPSCCEMMMKCNWGSMM